MNFIKEAARERLLVSSYHLQIDSQFKPCKVSSLWADPIKSSFAKLRNHKETEPKN
jgi:hypothetical protein